jgi:hypothetical protein
VKKRLSLLLLLGGLALRAEAAILETFDASSGDWQTVDYPFRNHVAAPGMSTAPFDGTFGNPAGSLRVGDVYAETGVAAPAAYLGDKGSCYGDTLTYDLFLRFIDVGAIYPAVVLNAGSFSMYYDVPVPAVELWVPLAIPLTEVGWHLSSSGALVDETTFRSALANLVGLYIYTEWHTGNDDTNVDNVCLNGVSVGVGDGLTPALALSPCYPNPFNPTTAIRFTLATAGRIQLRVVDTTGRCVRTLLDAWQDAGTQTVTWDGRDDGGRSVAAGVYCCRLAAAGEALERKMLLLK